MTIEEITQTLQTVAENQAKHDEMHARHSADIAEIDKQIAAVVESQNRHDHQLQRLFDVMGDLADKHLENEGRFASLAESQRRLEASYDLLESFVTEFRNDTRDYFAQTDSKLATLAGVQAATSDLLAAFVKETNERFAETDKKITALTESQARTDEQIKALILSQTRTDEMVRSLLERNGKPAAKTKKAAKKSKKGAK